MRQIFLDHQSTTPMRPEVIEAMAPFFQVAFGSASSFHRHGLRAREAIGKAREQIALMINAAVPEEILFTSGGTESANLAVKGLAYAARRRGTHIVTGQIEHPSVLNSIERLEKEGFQCTRVKVDSDGWIDPAGVEAALTRETILICVHHVNHDIGAIEPVETIGRIASERGIPLFVDATASGGWLNIDVRAIGASLLSLSPHRFYGPKGVGILYRNKRARLNNILDGGVQEQGYRPGTENVPSIVGAGVAAELTRSELAKRIAHTTKLQNRLWEGIRGKVPFVKLNGPEPGPKRIGTNLNLSTEFIEGEGQVLRLDMKGIAVASGPSCVSKSLKVPPVLAAIGLDSALAQGNILISLGQDNTEEEMDYVIETFAETVQTLRSMSPLWDDFERGVMDSVISPRRKASVTGATERAR